MILRVCAWKTRVLTGSIGKKTKVESFSKDGVRNSAGAGNKLVPLWSEREIVS